VSALPLVRLRELMLDVQTWNPLRSDEDDEFDYIDLSAVSQELKAISDARKLRCAEAPSRARQLVKANDVLVSTVRPNLNGVALVTNEFDGATASTGFCVARPNPERLNANYLFHWVKSDAFIKSMVMQANGASYPAVSDKIVLESVIPLPDISEQRRIAAILDKADALRAKRREALTQLDRLAQSIFVEMFGDPVINSRELPLHKLGTVGKLDRGVSKHRPRNAPELLGGSYPLVQTGDVANSGGYITRYSTTYSELGLSQSKLWPSGTLCITIAANIAKTGVLCFDACFPDSIVGFTADNEATVEYVRVWLSFLQKTLEDAAPESAQKNINLAILRDLQIPLPHLKQQLVFLEKLRQINILRGSHEKQFAESGNFMTSLQHRAFRGEIR